MSDKPRRWFRIHLSTAVVMMFVSGLLLWANLRVNRMGAGSENSVWNCHGWPFDACDWFLNPNNDPELIPDYHVWYHEGVIGNVLIAAAVLATVATTSEWRIRRREAHKP